MPRDETAYAANWRTVLLVDAAVAAVACGVGVFVMLAVSPALGGLVAAAGLTYSVLVMRRARHWARLRRAAGL